MGRFKSGSPGPPGSASRPKEMVPSSKNSYRTRTGSLCLRNTGGETEYANRLRDMETCCAIPTNATPGDFFFSGMYIRLPRTIVSCTTLEEIQRRTPNPFEQKETNFHFRP